ncbi:MAG: acyl CoA--acetate/3-ketoacid CoA transferase subunit beta, partial [Candidatus Methylomirabilaceae bacterium]
VVTSKALFGFDEDCKRMILLGVLRGVPVDEVLGEMEFAPLVSDKLEELEPPTPEETRLLRHEIDPKRAIIGKTAPSP